MSNKIKKINKQLERLETRERAEHGRGNRTH